MGTRDRERRRSGPGNAADTVAEQPVASLTTGGDTRSMRGPAKHFMVLVACCAAASAAFGDEIRLKDGKKLYGVIVGYEENMFRVKTDFGFVLVEKEKIAAIVPSGPVGEASAASQPAKPAAKPSEAKSPGEAAKSENGPTSAREEAVSKTKISDAPVKPSLPEFSSASNVTPPVIKPGTAPANPVAASAQPPAPPKEEPPPNREEVQGTLYTNFSHGFRMYKAPSWELIEDARQALPNAIVAMGTSNEATLMVVGREKARESLEASAAGVEKRLREIYSNYRLISQRTAVVGGAPAVEYKYRGTADEHDWSGTLVVIGRGKEVLTMLGMTYADSDLIQIQENVIARAIASMSFDVQILAAEK